MSIIEGLREFLGRNVGRRIVVMGVGSPIRTDDAAALLVIEELERRGLEDALLLRAESSPESFMGILEEHRPTHVIIIDAAELGKKPGEVRIVSSGEILGRTVSTHTLPLTILVDFLEGTLNARVIIIGIQPKSLDFGNEPTAEVIRAAETLAEDIYRSMKGL